MNKALSHTSKLRQALYGRGPAEVWWRNAGCPEIPREEYEENERRIRGKQEVNKSATSVHIPILPLAPPRNQTSARGACAERSPDPLL